VLTVYKYAMVFSIKTSVRLVYKYHVNNSNEITVANENTD